jgi:hypothetical protein
MLYRQKPLTDTDRTLNDKTLAESVINLSRALSLCINCLICL